MKPEFTFIRKEGDPLRCRECDRPEWEHVYVCDTCSSILPMTLSGMPSFLCHSSAWLVCRRKELGT